MISPVLALHTLAHTLGLAFAPKPGGKRSSQWPKIRAKHLLRESRCMVCGTSKKLNVHHCLPYHLRPDLELDPSNLITLCESTDGGCHLMFGHLGSFTSWNPSVRGDAEMWFRKIVARPTSRKT